MERLLKSLEGFLFHPLVWGVFAILALSIALSGKLSVNAAKVLLWIAYGASIFGLFRAGIYKNDAALRYLILATLSTSLAIGAVLLQRWFSPEGITPHPPVPPTANSESHGTTDSVATQPQHHGTEDKTTAKVSPVEEAIPTGKIGAAKWRWEKDPDNLTLHDLLLVDFEGQLMCPEIPPFEINSPNGHSTVPVEECVALDLDTNTKFVKFYIPNTRDTYDICEALTAQVGPFLTAAEKAGFHLLHKPVGESEINSSHNTVFSGRVFVYHEFDLTAEQIGDLTRIYSAKKLSLQLRGSDYLVYEQTKAKLKLRSAQR